MYNPAAIRRVEEFFSTHSGRLDPLATGRAEAKYDEIKRHTQAEFKQALGRFLEGDEQVRPRCFESTIVADAALVFALD